MNCYSVSFMKQLLLTVGASIGHLTTGFVWGWSLPTSNAPTLTKEQSSWVGAGPALAAVLGCFVAAPLMRWVGRKRTLMLSCPLFTVGWLVLAHSDDYSTILCGRLMTGVCAGIVLPAAQVYVAECASPEVRGILSSLPPLFKALGVLTAYLLSMALAWHHVAFACGAVPFAWFFLLALLPESPAWLRATGKPRESDAAIAWFGHDHHPHDFPMEPVDKGITISDVSNLAHRRCSVDMGVGQIKPKERRSSSHRTLVLVTAPRHSVLRPLLLTACLLALRQLTGVDSVVQYTVASFEAEKLSMSHVTALVLCVVQLVTSTVSIFIVDHSGRRPLLMVSGVCTALATAALGTYFYYDRAGDADHLSNLLLMGLIGFMVGYSVGFCSVPFVLMGEMLPEKHRSVLSSIASSVHFLTIFIIIKTYPALRAWIEEEGVFWIYCAFCVFTCVFVWLWVPETKGMTLDEIEDYFQGRIRKVEETPPQVVNVEKPVL